MNDRQRIAVHEAAHAVVASTRGWKVASVRIEPDGVCECIPPAGAPVRADPTLAAAGWAGTVLASDGPIDLMGGMGGENGDLRHLIREAKAAGITSDRAVTDFVIDAALRAMDVLAQPHRWRAVTRLAAALLTKGRLTGAEAVAIIDGASKGAPAMDDRLTADERREWLRLKAAHERRTGQVCRSGDAFDYEELVERQIAKGRPADSVQRSDAGYYVKVAAGSVIRSVG